MMLRLQCYDITLVYKKGNDMYLTDILSRAPNTKDIPPDAENYTFEVMSVIYISTGRLEELKQANNGGWGAIGHS